MDAEERGIIRSIRQKVLALLEGKIASDIEIPSDRDVEIQKLCLAFNDLATALKESSEFAQALSRGNLDTTGPVGNLMIAPLKSLHSTLRHLTWQTEQIAQGHLGQQVDFLGDFSRAYNAMLASIREKKRAEERLRKSENTLQTVLRTAPIGIGLTKKRVLEWTNQAMSAMTGYSAEELLGNSIRMLYASDDEYERVGREREQRLCLQGKLKTETRWLRKDGECIDVLVIASRIGSDKDQDALVLAVVDVTEIRRAQGTIEAQMRFLETMIEAIPGSIFYKDVSGTYLGCNSAFAKFLGVRKEKIVGSRPHDVAPEELACLYEQKDRELFSNPGLQVYESMACEPNGKVSHQITHKATFNGPDGNVAGLIGVMLDMTERKKIEKALEESEKRYRELVENASEGIVVVQDSLIVFGNRRFAELVGMPEQEIFDQRLEEMIYIDDREVVGPDNILRLIDQGSCSYRLRLQTRKGALRWVQMNLALVSWRGRPAASWTGHGYIRTEDERDQAEGTNRRVEAIRIHSVS